MKKEKIKIGVAWYTKGQWEILKKVADDSGNLDDTYNNWKTKIKKLRKEIKKNGHIPEKINIDIEKLKNWCLQNNKPVTQETRSEYVTVLLKEKYG